MTHQPRRTTGNLFTALGFRAKEAAHLKLRSDLMIALTRQIRGRGLTQVQAARLMGVSQPRVSDLMRGKIDRFSIDTLVAMLGHAGTGVSLHLRRRRLAGAARVSTARRSG